MQWQGHLWLTDAYTITIQSVKKNYSCSKCSSNWKKCPCILTVDPGAPPKAQGQTSPSILSLALYIGATGIGRFFRRRGLLDWYWDHTRPGDKIVVIFRVIMPCVVRQEGVSYRLFGYCYVDRAMDGEMVRGDLLSREEIVLG